MSITTTNPLHKTLSISNTYIATSSFLIPKRFHLSIPSKPTKLPSFSLKNPTFSLSKFIPFAQSSEWGQDSPNAVIDDGPEPSWGFQDSDFGVDKIEEEEVFQEPPEDAKLFVGNLSYDVDSERLAQIFEGAGVVEISEVIYNRETDRSRGFGFVTMRSVEDAEKAVEMFNGYELEGRLLTVNKAAPRGSRPEKPLRQYEPSFRIYVGNLPWSVDDTRLEQVFSEHGKVISARVFSDRDTGRSRGFGFVTMASETERNDAISALDGQNLDGRAIRVNVAEDRPRRF